MLKLTNYFHNKRLIIALVFTTTVIVLTHIPQESMPSQIQQRGLDKILHALAYGTITFFFILSLKSPPSLLSAFFLLFAISAIGILDEVTQPLVNRQASFADLVANVAGISTVLLFSVAGKHQHKRINVE